MHHTFVTAWIDHLHNIPHVPQCITQKKTVMLLVGTLTPAMPDVRLNLDYKC